MRVIIQPDSASASRRAARFVADLVRKKPDCVLGMATGSTPLLLYQEMIRLYRSDFGAVRPMPELVDWEFGVAYVGLAQVQLAKGDKEGAVDELLRIFEYDRKWNDEAARKQLVEFFNAYGPKDEVTLSGRRRLSSLMFS